MGKGDKKTRRGKIWRGTFGVLRRPSENQNKPVSGVETSPTNTKQS
ncbi:30S ribosomal protein THX [Dyadobacter sp. NIV53]|nr:30S ribosomal protein THX [Dyadobacter sp. NIV53]